MTECWPAPGKLNLFLHILGRRSDGYHRLQTAFQFLDVADEIELERTGDSRIILCNPVAGLPPEQDLTFRAADLLRQSVGRHDLGVSIRLQKRLPIGGGLGGGSSDAATVLVALNEIWALKYSNAELRRLAVRLGADVPVFVGMRAAVAEGVGEQLRPHEFRRPWYLIIWPRCEVSTRRIFNAPELTRDGKPIKIERFSLGAGRNDCEPVVRRYYQDVDQALTWLEARGPARLTGTGSCVFTWRDDREAVRALAGEVPDHWTPLIARGVNRSPLADRLNRFIAMNRDGGN